VNLTYTSREQVEVYRFAWPVAIGVPLAALFLQAFIPVHVYFFRAFDLPLLVTIFFGISRRNPITGLSTGAAIGIFQDALSHQPIGLFGIAKTCIGYLASSIGVKLDVDNPGSRFLMTYAFYIVHQMICYALRGMMGESPAWHWGHDLGLALANSLLAVVLFAGLDRFKQRT